MPGDGATINVGRDEEARQNHHDSPARSQVKASRSSLLICPTRRRAANAGLIGPLSMIDLSADVQKMIDSMKVGGITEPMRTAKAIRSSSSGKRDHCRNQAVRAGSRRHLQPCLHRQAPRRVRECLKKLRAQAIIEVEECGSEEGLRPGSSRPRLDS